MSVVKLLGLSIIFIVASNVSYAKNTAAMSSAEIGTLATIAAINKIEILEGVVASNKKPASNVADFAHMMISQHGTNLTQLLELANKNHVHTLTGGEADKLTTDAKKQMLMLGGLSEPQFDKAYVNAMVTGHQAALDLIDHRLMKTAKSEDVKKFVVDTRAVVAHHLEDAKKLQADMNS